MGMFKQLKDMKGMIEDAPDMLKNAHAMSAQAQEMAAAQQAAAQAQMSQVSAAYGTPAAPGAYAPDPAALTPIGGVTLEQYVEISKAIAAAGSSDEASAASVASGHGVSPENWKEAVDGWNHRIRTNGGVAHQFNQLYAV
ncbi:MAG: hypothetical protein ABSC56_13475 [Solirubrobacteraceae bacterium]|jgi:poly-gamma-glutamate capsule biosynthesis protein CapA/YwtB (metallophosphatase superfamily)